MALTKADLAAKLIQRQHWDRQDAADLVNDFFDIVREALAHGTEVRLSGFGGFELRNKRERPGFNPRTGESIPVTARRVVTFKPGLILKQRVGDHADPASREAPPSRPRSSLTKDSEASRP